MTNYQELAAEVASAALTTNHIIPAERLEAQNYHKEEGFPLCALIYYCYSVFGIKAANQAFRTYRVRVTKRYRKDGRLGIVYVYYDQRGQVRQIKEMGYNGATGRRLKEGEPCEVYNGKSRYYEQRPDGNKAIQLGRWLVQNFQSKPCFYGEHLIADSPDKPISIVESEKTAIICSICLPCYTWLATGGIYGCPWDNPESYEILRGRKIIVFPDLNATAPWQIKADVMRADGMDVAVYDLESQDFVTAADKEAGLDIGDYMIRLWQQEHPEAGETAEVKQAPSAVVPEVTNALSKLSSIPTVAPLETTIQTAEETSLNEGGGIGFFEIDLTNINS